LFKGFDGDKAYVAVELLLKSKKEKRIVL